MKKVTFRTSLLITGLSVGLLSCKKDDKVVNNYPPQANRTIDYSVNVVNGNTSSGGRVAAIAGVKVTLSVNGETMTKDADENGIATFTGLRPGVITAVVSAPNYTTVRYTANLSTSDSIDNTASRNAASMVRLYATSGPMAATIKGKLTAQLDLTNTGPENVPADKVRMTAYVSGLNATTMMGGSGAAGTITSSVVEGVVVMSGPNDYTPTGGYTIKVPAAVSGSTATLNFEDFEGTVIRNSTTGTGTTTSTQMFSTMNSIQVQVRSGMTTYRDVNFQ